MNVGGYGKSLVEIFTERCENPVCIVISHPLLFDGYPTEQLRCCESCGAGGCHGGADSRCRAVSFVLYACLVSVLYL